MTLLDELEAVALQLQELRAASAVNEPNDNDVARYLFEAELEARSDLLADRQLAQSMADAVQTDSALVTDLANQEARAQVNRHVAVAIGANVPEFDDPLQAAVGEPQADDQAGDQINDQTGNEPHDQIIDQTVDQTVHQTNDQTGDQLHNQVNDQTGNQPHSQIIDQTDYQVGDQEGEYVPRLHGYRPAYIQDESDAGPSGTVASSQTANPTDQQADDQARQDDSSLHFGYRHAYVEGEIEAGPSGTYSQSQTDAPEPTENIECTACTEHVPINHTVMTACAEKHRFCVACIRELFIQATREEPYYPARCCQNPIPIELVQEYLSVEEIAAYHLAGEEFGTRNRVYCRNAQCARFIPQDNIEAGSHRATCGNCGESTCALCNEAYHVGVDCPQDPALQQVRELAREERWQQCPRCNRLIELTIGCNHMRCLCGFEFCYVCTAVWKTCRCPYAEEDRLVARAQAMMEREGLAPQRAQIPPGLRQQRLNQLRERLVNHEDCAHPQRFEAIQGRGPGFWCEMCHQPFYAFILQCPLCLLMVCAHCRRHRL